jgi:hypothetical protein
MSHSPKPAVIRLFTNFTPSTLDELSIREGLSRSIGEFELYFNKSGKADLAVVINFARALQFVWGQDLKIYKWLMEPEIRENLLYRFTFRHSRVFNRVFCHNAQSGAGREQLMPPLIPPHVITRETAALIRSKANLVSAIASKETFLPLHRTRTQLIDELENQNVHQIDVFGKGRTYIDSKNHGLDGYMYSVAIENTNSKHYWTEKIGDCLRSLTVPIYFGCEEIEEYFPKLSFIKMKQSDFENGLKEVLESLSEMDYRRRIPALLEARQLLDTKYNFGYQIGELLIDEHQRAGCTRWRRVWDSNTLIHVAAKALFSVYRFLKSAVGRFWSASK